MFDQCECHQSEPYWFFASKVYVKDAPAGIGQQDKSVIHLYEENSEACHRSQREETGEE